MRVERATVIDPDTLEYFPPFKYIADLFRYGCVIRHSGRSGTLVYSEGWRHARFGFELIDDGVSVDLRSTRWWRLPFGLPFLSLTDEDKKRIVNRMQRLGHYAEFMGPQRMGL